MIAKGTARYEAFENYLLETINEEGLEKLMDESPDVLATRLVELYTENLVELLDGYVKETHDYRGVHTCERGH